MGADADDRLIEEQIDFYRTDAGPFDAWLGTLVDPADRTSVAEGHRAGRRLVARHLAGRAPLGDVLEIAAGTGRLAELYVPLASSALLLDASPESLAMAARRLRGAPHASLVVADVFEWVPRARFDTILFASWLHHVPESRFPAFWATVESLLAPDGRVIFDFPDAAPGPPEPESMPSVPTDGYSSYAPRDGIGVRDHFGRRWRIVHNLWHRDELSSWLRDLGWHVDIVGPGLFPAMVWAEATRRRRTPP